MECKICKNVSGEEPLFKKGRVYNSNLFYIEHAFLPIGILGWFVVVSKRHVLALHELDLFESQERSKLIRQLTGLLKRYTGCQKEYEIALCEAEGFNHLHTHIIAIPEGLPKEFRGKKIFKLMHAKEGTPVPLEDILDLCKKIKKGFE